MNLEDIVEELKETNYYQITSRQVEMLAALSLEEYKQVLLRLLQESVGEHSHLRGQEYRNTYNHRVFGCVLATMRPFDDLYKPILSGALGICDPTSIKYGALALLLIKPVEVIVSDLFEIAENSKNKNEILSHIAWIFYWLGFRGDGTWYQSQIILSFETDANISLLYNERDRPTSNEVVIASFGKRISEFMYLNYSQREK
jgi:hypothetical protein